MAAGGSNWWVIYNTALPGQTFPATSTQIPSSAQIVSAPKGSPPDMAWQNNGTYTGSDRRYAQYKGWARFMGPFQSEAQAKAARPPGGWAAIGDIIAAGVGAAAPLIGGEVPTANPLSGLAAIGGWLGELAHWAGELVTHLLDAAMWRSLGWILLGLLLVWLGVSAWLNLPGKVGVGGAVGAVTGKLRRG